MARLSRDSPRLRMSQRIRLFVPEAAVGIEKRPYCQHEPSGIMMDHPVFFLALRREQRGLDRSVAHRFDLEPVQMNRALPFKSVVAQDIAGNVFEIGAQDCVKQILNPSWYILIVGFDQFGDQESSAL